jgi:TetR/AcrR family transcriptional regulator, fatty acid metabolism regulator protein
MSSIPRQPSLKERQRQERETLILQAAQEAFLTQGYHETSLEEIAAQVGVSKGTIYQHFPTKEELLVALWMRTMQRFQQDLAEAIASASTARARLEALLDSLEANWSRLRIQTLLSFFRDQEVQRLFSDKSSSLVPVQQQLLHAIAALFAEGKATGEFNPTLPTQAMLHAFFSLFSPQKSLHLTFQEEDCSAEDLFKGLRHILFQGILPVHPPSEKARE